MSVARLKTLLFELAADDHLGVADVQALIDAATDEQQVSPGELLVLSAALESHRVQLDAEAYALLRAFLDGRGVR